MRGGFLSFWRSDTCSMARNIDEALLVYMVNPADAARQMEKIAIGGIPMPLPTAGCGDGDFDSLDVFAVVVGMVGN